MKKIFYTLAGMALMATACNQSSANASAEFKVWGNCGMCKKTIEKSLDTEGVSNASWDTKSKMIRVDFDSTKISLTRIHEKIAEAGYDTELKQANDQVYEGLHECCKYDRKKED